MAEHTEHRPEAGNDNDKKGKSDSAKRSEGLAKMRAFLESSDPKAKSESGQALAKGTARLRKEEAHDSAQAGKNALADAFKAVHSIVPRYQDEMKAAPVAPVAPELVARLEPSDLTPEAKLAEPARLKIKNPEPNKVVSVAGTEAPGTPPRFQDGFNLGPEAPNVPPVEIAKPSSAELTAAVLSRPKLHPGPKVTKSK